MKSEDVCSKEALNGASRKVAMQEEVYSLRVVWLVLRQVRATSYHRANAPMSSIDLTPYYYWQFREASFPKQ